MWRQFPWVGCDHAGAHVPVGSFGHALPVTTDPVEAILNRTWRPALAVTGAAHLPRIADAGNVLRPKTSLKLSMRLPPTVDGRTGDRERMKAVLEAESAVQRAGHVRAGSRGQRLERAADGAVASAGGRDESQQAFGRHAAWMGEGGTIPFMDMLGAISRARSFSSPACSARISNAHGPERVPRHRLRTDADRGRCRRGGAGPLSAAIASTAPTIQRDDAARGERLPRW